MSWLQTVRLLVRTSTSLRTSPTGPRRRPAAHTTRVPFTHFASAPLKLGGDIRFAHTWRMLVIPWCAMAGTAPRSFRRTLDFVPATFYTAFFYLGQISAQGNLSKQSFLRTLLMCWRSWHHSARTTRELLQSWCATADLEADNVVGSRHARMQHIDQDRCSGWVGIPRICRRASTGLFARGCASCLDQAQGIITPHRPGKSNPIQGKSAQPCC